ncbi:MAG: molybdenum cofactor guanylyltransferase [Chloroflexia bacterium]|nr:molybdenum cofactor guanylyltransferase [Chloroflexia bacterium]MDQ3412267.1 molybdenum cofactor guanylyltransferase [Chloroflexota bacterium]
MGSDKALLSLHPTGPPVLVSVIARLHDVTDDLFLVGVDRPGYDEFDAPLIADRFPGAGPLGGIVTALEATKHPHCLVVACDMPFLDPHLLRRMAGRPRDAYDVLLPVIPDPDRDRRPRLVPQTLHAIYSHRCRPAAERRLLAGERRISSFFPDVRVEAVDQAQLGVDDVGARSFFSVDTPAAMRQAREWLPR